MTQTLKQVNIAINVAGDQRNMKPSKLIKTKCKNQKEQLEVCYSLIDHFVGSQEAEWAILIIKTKKDVPRTSN